MAYAIDARGGLKKGGGGYGVIKTGKSKWLIGISRHETGAVRKAEGGGNLRQCGGKVKELTGGAHGSA
jgi:hypothetical protein